MNRLMWIYQYTDCFMKNSIKCIDTFTFSRGGILNLIAVGQEALPLS